MIHASAELLEAVAGDAPRWCDPDARLHMEILTYRYRACDGVTDVRRVAWVGLAESGSEHTVEHLVDVDCARCLALMATARGPERTAELLVYADHLEGVVAALDAVVAEGPTPEMTTAERTAILRSHNIARSKLRSIQSANLFVPGESAARRKTA